MNQLVEPIHVAALAEKNGWRPSQFGESANGIPLVAWWPKTARPTRIVWAAIHGEEVVTLQLLRHALSVIRADDACAVVIPVLNPDGVLAGTRQNARGVDLNRNFPATNWSDTPQPSFWPTAIRRTDDRRTQISSTGTGPGSEPEIAALCALIEELSPAQAVDFHTPLECVFAFDEDCRDLATHLAEPAGLPVRSGLDSPIVGDSVSWMREQGIICVTYEFELAIVPQLWHRHQNAIARAIVDMSQTL